MSTTVRYDEQYCPIARALDVLGDRWTLPILRELVTEDQRFSDLQRHLPGITPSVLTQRLKALVAEGMVASRPLADSPARSAYTLTEQGRTVVPVLRALAKWGMSLLEEPDDERPVRPSTAVNFAVAAYYDPVAALDIDERYLLRVEDHEVTLSSVKGGGEPHDRPDVVIESPSRLWIDLRQGRTTLAQAKADGVASIAGRRGPLTHFQRIFHVA